MRKLENSGTEESNLEFWEELYGITKPVSAKTVVEPKQTPVDQKETVVLRRSTRIRKPVVRFQASA